MQGAGNDFVVLDLRGGQPAPTSAQCRWLADRHFGVGCDQILTIAPARSRGAVASYGIWNADGSRASQCGNGARCVAAWLMREGVGDPAGFILDSPAGSHAVGVLDDANYRIGMGVPQFAPDVIPLRGFAEQNSYVLDLGDTHLPFGAVSMGNPHAVVEVADIDAAPVDEVGARLQSDAAFPESVNVGFVQIVSPTQIRLRVYERGVGETLACGSGACAAAAVLMRRGRVARDLVVSLRGGDLRIDWSSDDAPMCMSGSARFVFAGHIPSEASMFGDALLLEKSQ